MRDGRIYARGSVDDKGQLFLHVKALEAHLAVRGTLPVNVIVLAEGEEEVGSEHLEAFVERARRAPRVRRASSSPTRRCSRPGMPSILSSLRGLAYFQIDVQGPAGDLHSGSYGGAVVNPAMALARILATFHDADGRIAIPGFYDDVRDWPDARARADARRSRSTRSTSAHEAGAPALGGEPGYSTLERLWTRPTCEVNGLLSGYTGEGAKTVLPAEGDGEGELPPRARPGPAARSSALMTAHVARVAPAGRDGDGDATSTAAARGAPTSRARSSTPARRALAAAFGREPVIVGEGGSIPVVGDFERILGAPVLLIGFGLPGENAHAPNEWMAVENFEIGHAGDGARCTRSTGPPSRHTHSLVHCGTVPARRSRAGRMPRDVNGGTHPAGLRIRFRVESGAERRGPRFNR